jgi:hypothetical protein
MQFCANSKRLYSIYDSTFQMVSPVQRNTLQAIDVATQTVVNSCQEFSEQHELVCFAPLGLGGDWGHELVAGAVHGSAHALHPPCP